MKFTLHIFTTIELYLNLADISSYANKAYNFFFNPSRITQLLKNHPKAMDTYNYENIRDGFRIILKKKKAIFLCEALKIATVCLVCLFVFSFLRQRS